MGALTRTDTDNKPVANFDDDLDKGFALYHVAKRARPKRSGKFMTCTLAECHVKVCVLQMD